MFCLIICVTKDTALVLVLPAPSSRAAVSAVSSRLYCLLLLLLVLLFVLHVLRHARTCVPGRVQPAGDRQPGLQQRQQPRNPLSERAGK
jgi:hypothetical protein